MFEWLYTLWNLLWTSAERINNYMVVNVFSILVQNSCSEFKILVQNSCSEFLFTTLVQNAEWKLRYFTKGLNIYILCKFCYEQVHKESTLRLLCTFLVFLFRILVQNSKFFLRILVQNSCSEWKLRYFTFSLINYVLCEFLLWTSAHRINT